MKARPATRLRTLGRQAPHAPAGRGALDAQVRDRVRGVHFPQRALRASATGVNSTRMRSRAISISSAASIAKPVITPCPIPERSTISAMLRSRLMRSHGLSITPPLELGGLTMAAWRHLLGHPRLDERLSRLARERLDGERVFPRRLDDRQRAGIARLALHQHHAGAALAGAATIFRTLRAERVAQHPEQRRVCAPAKLAGLAVDRQRDRRPLFHSRLL
jgi:hypothetical protein